MKSIDKNSVPIISVCKRLCRRVLCFNVLLFCFLFPSACATASGSSYIEPGEESFIQENDEGGFVKEIVKLLIKKKYLPKDTPKGVFSPVVTDAVKRFQADNDLEATGMMDDDTLTLLVWDMLPEELDRIMPMIPGDPSTYPYTVYIPTDGGKKRHASPECCHMKDPRKVSIRNAEAIGFDACKIDECEADKEAGMTFP